MDYCDRCRRHLNGALTCAGCGRAAEELRWNPRPAQAPAPAVPPDRYGDGAAGDGGYGPDDAIPGSDDGIRRPEYGASGPDSGIPGRGYGVSGPDSGIPGPGYGTSGPRYGASGPDSAAPTAPEPQGAVPGTDGSGVQEPYGGQGRPDSPGAGGLAPDLSRLGDHPGGPADVPRGEAADPGADPDAASAGAEGATDQGEGGHAHRRAGRRPRAAPRRARSRRGRRILIGVLGMVLAAGVLSLAQLALDPGGATGPGSGGGATDSSTGLDYDGDPSAAGRPAVPGAAVADPETGGHRSAGAATGTPAGASPSASGDARKPGPGGSSTDPAHATAGTSPVAGDADGGTGGGATSTTGGTAGGTGGASAPAATGPAAPPPADTPAAPPPSSAPGHEPGKGHCRHVLLWCV